MYNSQRVRVIATNKSTYSQDGIIGLYGIVVRITDTFVAVRIDGKYNAASAFGGYWFTSNELEGL